MFDGCLTMSLQTLNHSSYYMLGYVNTPRNLKKIRGCPIRAVPPSSILLNTDESWKFPESGKRSGSDAALTKDGSANSFTKQGNTVGIIGGLSIDSTMKFMNKLVQLSSEDGENYLPFLLCSDPLLSKDLHSYERCSFLSLRSKGKQLQSDASAIVQNLWNKRSFLENSGAGCIVMPCHISHSWHEEVSRGCSVPFLDMGECVARELKEAELKPLEAGSPLRIGVLATNATLTAGFYQEKLQKEGFEVILPDKATMEHTVIPAIEAIDRKDTEGACTLLRIALQVLLVRAVNSVILASNDIQNLLPHDDPLLKKCINPIDALARSTIRWVKATETGK